MLAQPEKTIVSCGTVGIARIAHQESKNVIMIVEQLRDKALKLCADHGITAQPYAGGWWLVGEKINRVVGELAGLNASDLMPLPIMAR
jgi:hypothetical protein